MGDYDDLRDMGYGGPDGIDRLIEDCCRCTADCPDYKEGFSEGNCDECMNKKEDRENGS
jgi:hypothetical protein